MAAPGTRARRGLSAPRRAALDAAGWTLGALFAAASRARGGKAVHPEGVVHAGRLAVRGAPAAPPAARLLAERAEHPALIRFSRSLGVPKPLPDLLGISLRLQDVHGPGAHQDFLLVTSADLPLAHHGFLPAADFQQRPYTSSLPYRAGSDRFLVGVRPVAGSPRPAGGDEYERLARAAQTGRLRFELCVARVLGRFEAVADLHVGARAAPELDATPFNPWNTGAGLEPAGALNRLRDYAYPLSQRGWIGRR